jgi:hypothetical protein
VQLVVQLIDPGVLSMRPPPKGLTVTRSVYCSARAASIAGVAFAGPAQMVPVKAATQAKNAATVPRPAVLRAVAPPLLRPRFAYRIGPPNVVAPARELYDERVCIAISNVRHAWLRPALCAGADTSRAAAQSRIAVAVAVPPHVVDNRLRAA